MEIISMEEYQKERNREMLAGDKSWYNNLGNRTHLIRDMEPHIEILPINKEVMFEYEMSFVYRGFGHTASICVQHRVDEYGNVGDALITCESSTYYLPDKKSNY